MEDISNKPCITCSRYGTIGCNGCIEFSKYKKRVKVKTKLSHDLCYLRYLLSVSCNDDTQSRISALYDAMKDMQLYKNRKYGNAALEPLHVFFKGDASDSIDIRLDDKLSRIKNNDGKCSNNDLADFVGYVMLKLVKNGCTPEEIAKMKD